MRNRSHRKVSSGRGNQEEPRADEATVQASVDRMVMRDSLEAFSVGDNKEWLRLNSLPINRRLDSKEKETSKL